MDVKTVIGMIRDSSGLRAFVGSDEHLRIKLIPFGIPQLDFAIGGGVPSRMITELVGEYGVGKTFLSLQIVRSAQRKGMQCIYFNTEQKYNPDWAYKVGVDTDDLIVVQGNSAEHVFDSVIECIRSNVGLVIVDSLAALVPLDEQKEKMEKQTIGLQARVFSKGLRKIVDSLFDSDTAVVFTNQLRSTISAFTPDAYPGGRAQYFYSSLILHIRRGEWLVKTMMDGVKEREGFHIIVKSVKNILAPPWREVEIPFRFTTGSVDIVASLCQMALGMGIISQSGAWYTYVDKRMQGWDSVIEFFRDSNELRGLSVRIAGGDDGDGVHEGSNESGEDDRKDGVSSGIGDSVSSIQN